MSGKPPIFARKLHFSRFCVIVMQMKEKRMGEIALRRFFLAVFCALALSLSALAADAALPSLEAAVNVREDGVCEVTMTAEVDFSAAQDSLLIPLGTDARDITLAGWSYETVLQDGVTCLKLSNPAGFSGKQQFTCSYTLPCRAAEAADGQQFRLSLPETGWDYAIDSYTLTMTFPAEVTNAPEWDERLLRRRGGQLSRHPHAGKYRDGEVHGRHARP